MSELNKNFASHILRYVGIGLISGSIVHAGTLGGAGLKYIFLVLLGVTGFILGVHLEKRGGFKETYGYIFITVIISIGTGMVSGATQHFLDGPVYASTLLSLGLMTGYLAFIYRDFKEKLTGKKITETLVIVFSLWLLLYLISINLPHFSPDHHHSILNALEKLS